MVLRNFVFFQEALSEFEVVNMEGKTSDALTVCTNLSWKKNKLIFLFYTFGTVAFSPIIILVIYSVSLGNEEA